jgi:hypothetical protein
MVDFIRAGGWVMFVLIALGIAMLVPAALFARSATPQRLALIRALTVAMVFAVITGVTTNIATVCHYVVENAPKEPLPVLLQGFAESITTVMLGAGLASVAWILVAFGVRRMPHE